MLFMTKPSIYFMVAVITSTLRDVFCGGRATDYARSKLFGPKTLLKGVVWKNPLVSMMFRVLRMGHKLQILSPVIQTVSIYMVNKLFWSQRPAKNLFHYDSMLVRPLTMRSDLYGPVIRFTRSVLFFRSYGIFNELSFSHRVGSSLYELFSPLRGRRLLSNPFFKLRDYSLTLLFYGLRGPLISFFEGRFISFSFISHTHTRYISLLGGKLNAF